MADTHKVWTFVIPWPFGERGKYEDKPIPPLSLNHHISPRVAMGRSKRHRTHAARTAQLFRDVLQAPEATEHRTLRLTLVRGSYETAAGRRLTQPLLDVDGFYAALKPYVDGIKDAGWIVDDRPRWCDYLAVQERRAARPQVIVSVFVT